MTLLSCQDLKKSFADQLVLKEIQLDIEVGERIGLVGKNGAGKTTLAHMLFGDMEPDGGQIIRSKQGFTVGYLRQSTSYTTQTFQQWLGRSPEQAESATSMAADTRSTGSSDVQHTDGQGALFYETSGHLGLRKIQDWDQGRSGHLSGGERTKLALAQIWATRPDLLILDEPTNHMDFQGMGWLAEELVHYAGTALIISHDRYFLDQVVTRIVELEDGMLQQYAGNYTFYREEKTRRYQSQLHRYEEKQKEKARIETEIQRWKDWSSKAHREAGKVGKMAEMRVGVKEFYRGKAKKMDRQIKSRIKKLRRLETDGVQKPNQEAGVFFDLEPPEKRGRRLLEASRIGKQFSGGRCLFQGSSFTILRGEKVGLLGPNGCGKTTLLRMIQGREPVEEGTMWLSSSVRTAYMTQDAADLDEDKTAASLCEGSQRTRAHTLLAGMGFTDAMLQKPVHQLSLGERIRVKLAGIILQDHDLLILDEPTNHLDLHSREQLEETLAAYEGTVLLVSHDRYLLDRICDKMLVFHGKTLRKIEGGFKDAEAFVSRTDLDAADDQTAAQTERLDSGEPATIAKTAETKMIVENRISCLLGELIKWKPEDAEYVQLDEELQELMRQKQQLSNP